MDFDHDLRCRIIFRFVTSSRSICFFYSSIKRHTMFSLAPGVQTCALPIFFGCVSMDAIPLEPYFRQAREAGTLDILELDEGMLQWGLKAAAFRQIGRASCRERVCQDG